ncbi:DUF7556 family protein [Natrarchaeobius halalkaliphilus]|uniref:DUF7556 family protein n=1 Tax=Natrarchaeobius halalkaliphilus TaxID=1679091 RepID=UPI001404FD6F|nr:hypothetical protein [Natrarchaeobius halalkaliphilus]
MATNPHATTNTDTIVGSIDAGDASHCDEYVIADISADGAWLSMQAEAAPTLTAWR